MSSEGEVAATPPSTTEAVFCSFVPRTACRPVVCVPPAGGGWSVYRLRAGGGLCTACGQGSVHSWQVLGGSRLQPLIGQCSPVARVHWHSFPGNGASDTQAPSGEFC